MTRYYYAQYCPRGCTTAYQGDALYRFTSARDRDAWVRDGNARTACDCVDRLKHDQITSTEARRWYPAAFGEGAPVFPHTDARGDYWDDRADSDGAHGWSGAPTGGIYRDI